MRIARTYAGPRAWASNTRMYQHSMGRGARMRGGKAACYPIIPHSFASSYFVSQPPRMDSTETFAIALLSSEERELTWPLTTLMASYFPPLPPLQVATRRDTDPETGIASRCLDTAQKQTARTQNTTNYRVHEHLRFVPSISMLTTSQSPLAS